MAGQADPTNAAVKPVYDSTLPKGKVVDSVICKDQSYALYLPSYYSIKKQYPVIYFFDAHARGALPVYAYQALAEKYGFVLVGSNTSKNGMQWPEAREVVKNLMADVNGRVGIDPKRVYTSGFSGGSRVACSIAVVDGGVAGVIGCGAGFPNTQEQGQNKFDYFGIVGEHDFNLPEIEQWDATLEQNGFAHQIRVAAGIHGWASPADMQLAMLWMQVMAMKEQRQEKNDSIISTAAAEYGRDIKAAKTKGDIVRESELMEGMVRLFKGLKDIGQYQKDLEEIKVSTAYKAAIAQREQLRKEEAAGQQEMGNQFALQNEQYWSKKIGEFNKNMRTKPIQESQMSGRLLAYLGFVAYMNTDGAMKAGELAKAESYLRIFRLADPKNPDGAYLSAEYYMQKGNKAQAISSLKEAVSLGYNDVAQLRETPAFSSLANDAEFRKIVEMAVMNNRVTK